MTSSGLTARGCVRAWAASVRVIAEASGEGPKRGLASGLGARITLAACSSMFNKQLTINKNYQEE